MRFEILRQIIARVQRDVRCPQCGKSLGGVDMRIFDLDEENVELNCQCPGCEVGIDVLAQVEVVNRPTAQSVAPFSRQHNSLNLSQDSVQKISQALKDFKGKDVRELF